MTLAVSKDELCFLKQRENQILVTTGALLHYICNEYALCSIHEPPSAHVRGLGLSAILLYSFSLIVCSQLDTILMLSCK